MTNTIPNVPRELKPCPFCGDSELLGFEPSNEGGWTIVRCRRCGASGSTGRSTSEWEAAAYWNRRATSPAGVDGLAVSSSGWFSLVMNAAAELETASYSITDPDAKRVAQSGADYYRSKAKSAQVVCLSDAQAIIDGLRGEVGAQRVKTCTALKERNDAREERNDAREERNDAREERNDAREERDQQAQRICELEGLLRSCLPALSDGGCAALANRIDAALSAGKEGE